MRHIGKLNGQKGFTLLEMLVAVSLIAIGMLATAAMQSVALNSNSIANRSTVVTAIAQEVMEEIMSRPPDDPQLTAAGTTVWPSYDLNVKNLATTDRSVSSAGTFRVLVSTRHPSASITQVSVTVTRVNPDTNAPYANQSDKALSGVHSTAVGAGGGFVLTDYKNISGV